jgi:hypothetical protein
MLLCRAAAPRLPRARQLRAAVPGQARPGHTTPHDPSVPHRCARPSRTRTARPKLRQSARSSQPAKVASPRLLLMRDTCARVYWLRLTFARRCAAYRHLLEPLAVQCQCRVIAFDRPAFGGCRAARSPRAVGRLQGRLKPGPRLPATPSRPRGVGPCQLRNSSPRRAPACLRAQGLPPSHGQAQGLPPARDLSRPLRRRPDVAAQGQQAPQPLHRGLAVAAATHAVRRAGAAAGAVSIPQLQLRPQLTTKALTAPAARACAAKRSHDVPAALTVYR